MYGAKIKKLICLMKKSFSSLCKIVRDNMKEFQAWSWIEERQAHYMNNLQKVYEEQERARKEFEKQEGLTSSQQTVTPAGKVGEESSALEEATDHDHKMDCAVEASPGGYIRLRIHFPSCIRGRATIRDICSIANRTRLLTSSVCKCVINHV